MMETYRPSRVWRLNPERYRLEGTNCNHCGIKHFPGRQICPDCRNRDSQEPNNLQPEREKVKIIYSAIPQTG